jgi:hypothetical protein
MCFSFVSTLRTVPLPVSFWLTFEEMERLMAGDQIDKSILLCSLLRALGSENAKVFVCEGGNSHVLFQFAGKTYVADHSKTELTESLSADAAYSLLAGKILYAFNDKEHEDFAESE